METLIERFLKYVKINTASNIASMASPSTKGQLDLAEVIKKDLKDLGLDPAIDEFGNLTVTVKSNSSKKVPVIAFISHLDTSDEVPSEKITPMYHKNFDGKSIHLPKDDSIISTANTPNLAEFKGHDLITSDGSTLLGGDDKAGIAIIMELISHLLSNPDIKHGEIKILFNPDEEIARGVSHFDVKAFGAQYGYTLDGGGLGEIEYENFNADYMVFKFNGYSVHPGQAKGKMINSIKVATNFLDSLPKDKLSPETTEAYGGFVHPVEFIGKTEATELKFIVRDFDLDNLKSLEKMLIDFATNSTKIFPGSSYTYTITNQYRNMKYILERDMKVFNYALDAMRNLGITHKVKPIRGGTDGAHLSYMGLPTPNIFSGQHNMHGKLEFVSVNEMQKSVEVLVELCKIWEERS